MPTATPVVDRFWAKVQVQGDCNECNLLGHTRLALTGDTE